MRTLLEEVNITARRDDPDPHARLVLRWKGGAISTWRRCWSGAASWPCSSCSAACRQA